MSATEAFNVVCEMEQPLIRAQELVKAVTIIAEQMDDQYESDGGIAGSPLTFRRAAGRWT